VENKSRTESRPVVYHPAAALVISRLGSSPLLVSALLLLLGCDQTVPATAAGRPGASPAGRPGASAAVPETAAFPVAPGQPLFGRVYAARFQLALTLPHPDGWQLSPERSSFLVLHHAASSSSLVVRLWQEDENMSRAKCEERARLRRDFPDRTGEQLVDSQPVAVPPSFDTRIDVGFSQSAPQAPIRGYALAFGGYKRSCFAYVYTTEAAGAGAERLVGDRLAVMHGRGLLGVELRRSTDIAPIRR